MSRIQIPLDVLTSRLNVGDRFQALRSGPLSGRFSNLRPVSEFFDFKRLSRPANFGEMQSRVNYNLSYFSSNYAVVFAMLSIYALLTNWLLLFDIILVVAGMFLIGRLEGRDLEVGSFRATTSQLYTGLLIVAVPLGLIASPFSTLLWLIGASGVAILGHASFLDKPIDEAFSGEARGRRKTEGDAAHYDYWGDDSRVEELDTDGGDDTDTQGVGATSRRNRRFVSDSLQFTGVDLGDRASGTVRRRRYGDSDDDGDDDDDDNGSASSDDDDNGAYGEGTASLAIRDKEEALIQSALQRINRAQAKGKANVKLNKEELAALERRRERMQEEERKKRGGSDRKKKEQRIAVPLSHFEPVSRKKRTAGQPHPPRQGSTPRHASADGVLEGQQRQGYPPMGYFPPPSASRSRPRSGTTSSRPPSRARDEGGSSPLQYEYVPPPSAANRRVSDSVARPLSSRGSPRDEASSSLGSRPNIDPFMYQTEGPRAAYPAGAAAASRRYVSGPAETTYNARPGAPAPAASRSYQGSRRQSYGDETSEDESVTSDDRGNGAQIREPTKEPVGEPVRERAREPSGRDVGIVVEVEPEPETPKKKSSVKRKPVSGGRRKKR
ncbi:COPII vesicles protein Yip3 [Tolypocladium capitatum]|uniref:COPII vesicles protein Yip3 n=1 Tax=Tolypocladium capitatum TaxID=45235 RepID=A0A2K3QPG6_9HYPO|nr:COPII vesicles protein Yip3 [Tolypocladium capitatum]